MIPLDIELLEDKIKNLSGENKYEELDKVLKEVDTVKVNIVVLLAYLKFTKEFADKLPSRQLFIDKINEAIKIRADAFYKAVEEYK